MKITEQAIRKRVGEGIRAARHDRGLTQPALANRVGVSAQVVSRWERSQTVPSTLHLSVVCGVLGIDPGDLYAAP